MQLLASLGGGVLGGFSGFGALLGIKKGFWGVFEGLEGCGGFRRVWGVFGGFLRVFGGLGGRFGGF